MARIDVVMPQMGESIAEGTLSKWLKKVGDTIKRDEPIFEISTDKVDAEIPSATAGVLAEIIVVEGQTVACRRRSSPASRLEAGAFAAVSAPGASLRLASSAATAPADCLCSHSRPSVGCARKRQPSRADSVDPRRRIASPAATPSAPQSVRAHFAMGTAIRSKTGCAPNRPRSFDGSLPSMGVDIRRHCSGSGIAGRVTKPATSSALIESGGAPGCCHVGPSMHAPAWRGAARSGAPSRGPATSSSRCRRSGA